MAGQGRRSLATDYIMDKLLRMKLTSDRAIIGRRGSRGRTARGDYGALRSVRLFSFPPRNWQVINSPPTPSHHR